MHRIMPLTLFACLAFSGLAWSAALENISNRQATTGLKDALIQGAGKAVSTLGAQDGFLGNDRVKIPLPPAIEKIESGLKFMGMDKQADDLVVGMNRAAEMAVHEATPVLVDAVKKMSVKDAKGILTGGDDAATQYFRQTTSAELTDKFLPIVEKMTARLQLAGQYDQLAGQASKFGLVKPEDASVDSYVTRKALDGLFFMIGEEEKKIRADPVSAATSIAKQVFGALGH
jgi:Protein of unknown function (DUF4197)